MATRKIALFGGTFDPIHLGHTTVAAEAAKTIGAEKVVFVPAKQSPLKGFSPIASDRDRLNMIALALTESSVFTVSDYELRKNTSSYTARTVQYFQQSCGTDTLIYWLIGADSIDDLPCWHKITDLIDQCNIATVLRGGCKKPDFARFTRLWGPKRVQKLQKNIIQTPMIRISSTEVRNRISSGCDVSNLLHRAVADYIHTHGLYHREKQT